MNKAVLVWGYIASFILLLGAIFMNLNFIAGKVLYLTGFFSFNLGYLLPLFLVMFQKNQENKIGLVLVFGVLGFLTFLTGVSFFVVNWGGGIILIYVGGSILILAILTIISLSRRFYETHIDSWFPILIFGVFIVISLLTGMVHRHVMRVFTLNNMQSVELLESINAKNIQLYQQISMLDTLSNTEFLNIKTSVKKLKTESDIINHYIDEIKICLIRKVEGEEYEFIDFKALDNLVPVQSNVEINSVRRFMLSKKNGRAYQLKDSINSYHQKISALIPADQLWLIEYTNRSLNTGVYNLEDRKFNQTWEEQNFLNFPLITVLNQLTDIQRRIKSVEAELLNYYHKKALRLSDGIITVAPSSNNRQTIN